MYIAESPLEKQNQYYLVLKKKKIQLQTPFPKL